MGRESARFPLDHRHVLKHEDRRRELPPDRILAFAQIQPGETVVDLGAGTGYWTEPLARLVGSEGRVFAVDIEPVMLEELRALVREQGLSNVEVVGSEDTSVPLEAEIADLVLLAFVLHHAADPPAFLQEVVRLLEPDGRVLLLDWHDRPTEHGPPLDQRISEEEARALLGAAGLSVDELPFPNEDVYLLLAREFRQGDPEIVVPTV